MLLVVFMLIHKFWYLIIQCSLARTTRFVVFSRMGLKLKPPKCHLFQKEITYLGHYISKHGVKKVPEKTCKVDDWAVPNCVWVVSRFVVFLSWCHTRFAKISTPMLSLWRGYSTKRTSIRIKKLKEEELWEWSEEQQASFDNLRKLLIEDVTHAFADFKK